MYGYFSVSSKEYNIITWFISSLTQALCFTAFDRTAPSTFDYGSPVHRSTTDYNDFRDTKESVVNAVGLQHLMLNHKISWSHTLYHNGSYRFWKNWEIWPDIYQHLESLGKSGLCYQGWVKVMENKFLM